MNAFDKLRSNARVDKPPRLNAPAPVKAVAFYLPQYHPVPVNDEVWGTGFTEWSNVARGAPEFTGHRQPRLPADYGFYDLRLAEIQRRQTRDAEAAGIAAFCYYYYWFDGEMPLKLPLERHLADDAITQRFCLCFANENWTRTWDGLEKDVILAQNYGPDFADKFWADIVKYLRSEKYLRDDEGRPFLLVYRPSEIPGFEKIAETWRALAREEGFPGLKVIACLAFQAAGTAVAGADAAYEFPPLNSDAAQRWGKLAPKSVVDGRLTRSVTLVHDYRQFAMRERLAPETSPTLYPTVMPDWDNAARRPGRGNAFADSTPALFEEWTERAARRAMRTRDRLLFVNAWNEWAEGAYLEPDQRFGWAYLTAFRNGLARARLAPRSAAGLPICVFVHVHYPELWNEIADALDARIDEPFSVVVTSSSPTEFAPPRSPHLRAFEIHRVENRGRDILPFLAALERTKIAFDIGLKLHTKRSLHRQDGDLWRTMLIDDLLPRNGIGHIAALMRRDPNCGFVAPEAHFEPIGEYAGSNLPAMFDVFARSGFDASYRDFASGRFIAGSMFWFRADALRALSYERLEGAFESETGQVDGTAAHAMERLFSLFGERLGYYTLTSGEAAREEPALDPDPARIGARLARFSDQLGKSRGPVKIALSQAGEGALALAQLDGYSLDLPPGDLYRARDAADGMPIEMPAAIRPPPLNLAQRIYHRLPADFRRRVRRWMGRPIVN